MNRVTLNNPRLEHYKYLKDNELYNNLDYKIYSLINPLDDNIFYIGCTRNPLIIMVLQHYTDITTNNKKNQILNEITKNNKYAIVEVLYIIKDKIEAKIVEQHLINFLSKNKHKVKLTNKANKYTIVNNYKNVNYGSKRIKNRKFS